MGQLQSLEVVGPTDFSTAPTTATGAVRRVDLDAALAPPIALNGVTRFTGGTTTDLDHQNSADLVMNARYQFMETSTGIVRTVRLIFGTQATAAPAVTRTADFVASARPTVFVLEGSGVGTAAGTVAAGNDPRLSVGESYYPVESAGTLGGDTANFATQIALAKAAGGGVVKFGPGVYHLNGQVIGALSQDDASYSCISLVGCGATTTYLNIQGPSTGFGLRLSQNRYAVISDFYLSNQTGSVGTIEGIQLGGFNNGTSSQRLTIERLIINGFARGLHASTDVAGSGDGGTTSEAKITQVQISNCGDAYFADNFNGLNLLLDTVDAQNCTAGFNLRANGTTLLNCSGEGNVLDIRTSGKPYSDPTVIINFRSENAGLCINAADQGDIHVIGLKVASQDASKFAAVGLDGVYTINGQHNPTIFLGPGIVALIQSSRMLGPVAFYNIFDLLMQSCTVAGPNLLRPRQDFGSPAYYGKYQIQQCSTSSEVFYDKVRVADRKGSVNYPDYVNPQFVDANDTVQTTATL